ncbi:alpha-ketoacid dehydrogenase subunit beta [Acidobacteria bacterium AH-259-G07]|nr:alpha-ketoacid dehydrogenase subunit beta [Acidobacteria bacterium AH-259-G07]
MRFITYREALHQSMRSALEKNCNSFIFGLGVTDHTGIFGTTLGLEGEFGGDRVFNTPICEEAMTGFALGASLRGLYPIHIHIRNDFLPLAMNQLINCVAKYKYMYGGLFEVPMLVRAVIGRSWGQGGTHSQSLQALFAHIPGLTVVMPSNAKSVISTYDYVVNHYRSPVLSLEHRLLYEYSFTVEPKSEEIINPLTSFLVKEGSDVTVTATSLMVHEAKRAADFVKKHEAIEVEIIDLHCVSHPDVELILRSVKNTGKLIVADTGWAPFGVCAEVSRIVASADPSMLSRPVINLSMAPTTCPTAKALEKYFYPDFGDVVHAIYTLVFETSDHGKELPSEEHKASQYKEFKGPF